jgi:FMN phosphatase YigB (HAD superfamily)
VQRTKVIFLDIDGVLNSNKTPNPRRLPYVVDKRRMRVFKRLIARTRAKVVLISDWRNDPAGLFAARFHGIRYHDVVPDQSKKSRGDQVRAWLRKHPKVFRYAVLDDDDDQLDDLPLFQPSNSTGLTSHMAQQIEKYLSGRTDKDMRSGPLARTLENARKRIKRLAAQ